MKNLCKFVTSRSQSVTSPYMKLATPPEKPPLCRPKMVRLSLDSQLTRWSNGIWKDICFYVKLDFSSCWTLVEPSTSSRCFAHPSTNSGVGDSLCLIYYVCCGSSARKLMMTNSQDHVFSSGIVRDQSKGLGMGLQRLLTGSSPHKYSQMNHSHTPRRPQRQSKSEDSTKL